MTWPQTTPPSLQHPLIQARASQSYGKELEEAYEWLQKFRRSRKEAELHQAWDLYYHVFKRINKQLPQLTVLELHYVSPALANAEVCQKLPPPSTFVRILLLCSRSYISHLGVPDHLTNQMTSQSIGREDGLLDRIADFGGIPQWGTLHLLLTSVAAAAEREQVGSLSLSCYAPCTGPRRCHAPGKEVSEPVMSGRSTPNSTN